MQYSEEAVNEFGIFLWNISRDVNIASGTTQIPVRKQKHFF